MLTVNLYNTLQALANPAKQRVSADARHPALPGKLEVGQQLLGTVQSKVSAGIYTVQVAGQAMQMRLPGHVQNGDSVKLQIISLQPKITFGVAASVNPISTPEQIGSSARMLSNLADMPLEKPMVQQMSEKAVWAATEKTPDIQLLANGLREALSKSGLFYESHQAQWLRGERSIRQLLEEPQNILTSKAMMLTPSSSPAPEKAAAQLLSQAASKNDGHTAMGINKDVLPLVQQQLHTLENQHLAWIGQVWPDQQMQWEIQGEPEQEGQQRDERQWSTEMELSLPQLGNVNARMIFSERGLRLTLQASNTQTADLFNASLPQLRNALDNAGVLLSSAIVETR